MQSLYNTQKTERKRKKKTRMEEVSAGSAYLHGLLENVGQDSTLRELTTKSAIYLFAQALAYFAENNLLASI